jgi:hypothetical protein
LYQQGLARTIMRPLYMIERPFERFLASLGMTL